MLSARLCIYLIAVGILSGCAAIIPHTLMTPTVRQRGEAEISTSVGLHGISVQAAYTPSDNIVLLASGHHWTQGYRWSWAGEAGGGRQWIRPNGGSWGIYGGAGYGAAYSYDPVFFDGDEAPSGERVRYTYAFVQPTYTLVSERTSLGFAIRFQPLYLNRWETYGSRSVSDSLLTYTGYYPISKAGH
jgi:hypothetical protein